MLVLGEATGNGAPADFVVVVGEPLVLQQEGLLAVQAGGVGIQLMDTHVAVADVDLVLVLVDEHGERVLAGSVAHIIQYRHAVEDAVGVVHIEQLAVA